jgi:predicted Zn-dependent peptidase
MSLFGEKMIQLNKDKIGIIAYRVSNPNFKDYLCEQIYKNIMTNFDDSLLFKFIRENEKSTYSIIYSAIDGVNERIFYFYFIGNPKNIKNVKKKIDFRKSFFKQTKYLFNLGKKRTIVEFIKSSENQSDFTDDIAYYYAMFGVSLDKKSLIKEIENIKYRYYKKWMKKIYQNVYIL